MKISINPPICINELGKRSNQEDSVFPAIGDATDQDKVFILCDGMGGHDNGEVASGLVCNCLSGYIKDHWDGTFFSDQLLQKALDETMEQMNQLERNSIRKPGTTMTFLCFHRGGATVAHIGDSRIYHIRPSEKRILYKSRDHSLVYDLFLTGDLKMEEMKTYSKKNVLTRAIIPNEETTLKADVVYITNILPGDYFLLCSDGVLENMSDAMLVNLLCSNLDEVKMRQELIQSTANNADNHSAYLIRISNVEREENDDQLFDNEATSRSNAILLEGDSKPVKPSLLGRLIRKITKRSS